MWFGELALEQCAGCVLAHSQLSSQGRIAKGTVLSQETLDALRAEGHTVLTVARLEPDDVEENAAALQLATAAQAGGVRADTAHTGRVNLHAATDGLLSYQADALIAANSVSDDITLSVLGANQWVLAGRLVASAKIIPYAVPKPDLLQATELISGASLSVRAPVPRRAVLVQTTLPSIKSKALDKTVRVTSQRLAVRSSTLVEEYRCEHNIDALVESLAQALTDKPDIILIVGGSAISDQRDVLPSAVRQAGGTVRRVGLPVDPGNLLMLAEIDRITVLGLPGCARSPKHNGLDLLLDRIVCGLDIDDPWMNQLCIGGLLGEVHDRPQPRVSASKKSVSNKQNNSKLSVTTNIAALVLAAGSSRRAGVQNKLLYTFNGKPLVCSVVASVQESDVAACIAVTGFEADQVTTALADSAIELHHCPTHTEGMGHSIAAGISHLQNYDAVLVCLGDMPHVSTEIINRIIHASHAVSDAIVVPVCKGQRGNPVMIGRSFFDSMLRHQGDSGARFLIKQYPEKIVEVEIDDESVLQDYDTVDQLQTLS